jgi:hypothetical protein
MFAKEIYRELFHIAGNAGEVINYLLNYTPVELDRKWFVVPHKKKY